MTSRIRRHRIEKIFLLLTLALFCIFLYTFLHEGGHALAGILSGGTVTGFSVNFLDFSARVSLSGRFTQAEAAANALAGTGLPLLVWLVFIVSVPKRTNFALESLKLAATMMFLSTLLAWVFLPLVYGGGHYPRNDVTDFLMRSGASPLGTAAVAMAAYIGGWRLFVRKIDGLRREVELLRDPQAEVFTPHVRATVWVVLGILAVCLLAAFAANGFRIA